MLNNPAPPNPQTGIKPSPFDSGVRIAFAQATPLFDGFSSKEGAVNVHFNGAAAKPVYVDVSAQPPEGPFIPVSEWLRLIPAKRTFRCGLRLTLKSLLKFH